MCNQFAARGYVVANTEYRLGWNPYLPTEPERALSGSVGKYGFHPNRYSVFATTYPLAAN